MAIPSPNITLTGTFIDSQGNAVNGGTVTATLQNYGGQVAMIAGSAILETTVVTTTMTGTNSFSISLYANDQISPAGTWWSVAYPGPGSSTTTKNYQLNGVGSFDLSNLTPLNQPATAATVVGQTLVQPFTAVAHKFITGMTTAGALIAAQPAPADLTATPFNSPLQLGQTDTGLSRTAAGTVAIGNGTQGDASGTLKVGAGALGSPTLQFGTSTNTGFATTGGTTLYIQSNGLIAVAAKGHNVQVTSGAVLGYTADSIDATIALDTGISRTAAATVAVGNGTQGDFSGQLKLGNEVLTSAAPTVAASQVGLGSTTATSATAGANGAVPAQVAGYLIINVAGTVQKIPYFNT